MQKCPWQYDQEKAKRKLLRLKERYFRAVQAFPEGTLAHHGDCDIYRSPLVYGNQPCTCGLLHDLRHVPQILALKLHPALHDEELKMVPDYKPMDPEALEESRRLLKEVFGEPVGPSPQEWHELSGKEWELIEEVFGNLFRQRKEAEWLALDEDEGF